MEIATRKAALIEAQTRDEEKVKALQERMKERARKIDELGALEIKFTLNQMNMTQEQLIQYLNELKRSHQLQQPPVPIDPPQEERQAVS